VNLNNLEQYSRRCCLEFQGITPQPSECTDEIVVNLVKKCGINITSGDISISHRLAPPTKKYPNPIIIAKFNSQKLRNSSKRMKLKNVDRTMSGGSKLYIKESLTKLNKQIFSAALSSDVSESFLSSQSRVIVTSPSSQSHLKFFRVDSEPWFGRVESESSNKNCWVTSSHWFASSSQCRVTRNLTFFLRHFFATK